MIGTGTTVARPLYMRSPSSVLGVSLLIASASSVAHAENPLPLTATIGLVEVTPLVFGTVDLVARPHSKIYGAFEIGAGAAAVALNAYVAAKWFTWDSGSHAAEASALSGLGLFDAAIVVQGIYLVSRPTDDDRLSFRLGHAYGHLAPALVSDGKATAPGFGLGGTF